MHAHYRQLQADKAANLNPICATFRLDGGFTSLENIYWLIEMGYDVYTRGRFPKVGNGLSALVTDETDWCRVSVTTWPHTTVDGYFARPLDVALLHYHTGDTVQRVTLLHYGQTDVVADQDGWFHTYTGRQTIEAGIKEGKNVFQMHHLKVRSPAALFLQEQLACFAAAWLVHKAQPTPFSTQSIKQMVQVAAHTSVWVQRHGDVWFLTFTEQSCYASCSLRFGNGVFQLPLPLYTAIHFSHF